MESLSFLKFCLWTVLFCAGFQETTGQMNGMGEFPPSGTVTFQYGLSQIQNEWRKVTAQGKVFVTMFRMFATNEIPTISLTIPGTCPSSTSVSRAINNSDFKKDARVKKRETATFEYPNQQQITGSGTSSGSMIITANGDITMMSYNYKGTSGDVALIYPVDQWGTEYYIVTPIDEHSESYAEFVVLAYKVLTRVTMVLSGAVQHNGKNYNKGDTMIVDLEPFQFLPLRSKDNLSGTTVMSQHPAAVLSGHSCVSGIEGCSHVYEQLLPEKNWGKSYYVPVPSFLSSDCQVYVLASKATQLEYQSGEQKLKTNLEAGKVMTLQVSASEPLSIHSKERIQVLLYRRGGNFEGNPFGSFLTKIPSIESFNFTYNLIGQKDFDTNLAVIIAEASSVSGLLLNGKALQNAKWKAFPDSEYVSSEISYGEGYSCNTVTHPTAHFGLLTFGYSNNMAYGTVAAGVREPVCPLLESNEICLPFVLERKRRRAGNDF